MGCETLKTPLRSRDEDASGKAAQEGARNVCEVDAQKLKLALKQRGVLLLGDTALSASDSGAAERAGQVSLWPFIRERTVRAEAAESGGPRTRSRAQDELRRPSGSKENREKMDSMVCRGSDPFLYDTVR